MVICNRFVDCHWCRYLSCGNYLELWLFWASRYQEVCRYINWLARLQTFKTLLVYQLAITNIPILNVRNVYIYCTHVHKYQLVCPSCQCEVWPKALVSFFGEKLWPEQSTFELINRWLMGDQVPICMFYLIDEYAVCWACSSCGSCWSSSQLLVSTAKSSKGIATSVLTIPNPN